MSGYHDFAESYDLLTSDIPYGKRGEYFHTILQKFQVPCVSGNSRPILLDLACGTGSLSEVMAGLGYDVIGVDASEQMLGQAMEKKFDSGLDILYLCQEMQELDLYGTVDCAVCALDSLNHITDIGELRTALERVSLFLAPSGLFLFDVNTMYKHEQVLAGNTFIYDYDEVFCAWQNSECHNGIVDITLDLFLMEENGAYFRQSETFSERAYSHLELCALLQQAGLELLACYAGDTLEPTENTTERAVYVTRSRKQ